MICRDLLPELGLVPLLRVSLDSPALLDSQVLDVAVSSTFSPESSYNNLIGSKAPPLDFLAAFLLPLEDFLETHNSLLLASTPPAAAAPPVLTPLREDRRTFMALDGLGFLRCLTQFTTHSVLASLWTCCRSEKTSANGE